MTKGKALKLCYLASGNVVKVSVGPLLVAHVSGIHRCGSVWACPLCAPVVRHGRAVEIDRAGANLLAAGGCALLVSATGPHRKGDPLEPLFDLACRFSDLTMTGAKAKRLRDRLGYLGAIRAVEVTYGRPPFDNGWHPHVHLMMCFDRPLSPSEIAEFRAFLFGRWQKALTGRGFGELHPVNGLDVRPVYDSGHLSEYLTKVEGGWSIGSELARGDSKHKGQSPFDLLAEWAVGGDLGAKRLWQEYEKVTFGRKAIHWSPGLRRHLLGDLMEASDLELALKEGEDEQLVTFVFQGEEWDVWVRAAEVGLVLRQVEEAAALLLFLAGVFNGRTVAVEGKIDVEA